MVENYDNTRVFEKGQHSHIVLRPDGIILLTSRDEHCYSIEDIKENWAAISSLCKGKKAYVLSVAGKYTSVDSEVREFVSKGLHAGFIAAECFVIHSLPQKLLANFYFKMNKPVVPSAFFTDRAKAEKWLKERMKEEHVKLQLRAFWKN